MESRYVSQLNTLYDLYDEARRVGFDSKAAQIKIADALAQSCLLLQDLLKDDAIARTYLKEGQKTNFKKLLDDKVEFRKFIEMERKLLHQAGLNETVVNALLSESELIVDGPGYLPSDTHALAFNLMDRVCSGREIILRARKRGSILKRVVRAIGGGVIIVVDSAPPIMASIPTVAIASIGFGGHMLASEAEAAYRDIIDHFIEDTPGDFPNKE